MTPSQHEQYALSLIEQAITAILEARKGTSLTTRLPSIYDHLLRARFELARDIPEQQAHEHQSPQYDLLFELNSIYDQQAQLYRRVVSALSAAPQASSCSTEGCTYMRGHGGPHSATSRASVPSLTSHEDAPQLPEDPTSKP